MEKLGEKIIKALNKEFSLSIKIDKETISKMEAIISDFESEIMEGGNYGYCPDCDERRPDEPSYNEGYY